MSYPRMHMTITPEQREWVKNHPEINVSGLIQEKITYLMRKEKQEGNQPSKPRSNSVSRRIKEF